jgi:hypothetical protein
MAARFGLALVLLLAAPLGVASAQQLARLHVQSVSLTSDTLRPKVNEPYTVTLTIHVRDNVKGPFANVLLPAFIGPEELGDERVVSHGPGGTVYSESLRLVSRARGPVAIGSAYLDAIDARDGKPKRFISNDLHLYVEGGPALDLWRPVLAVLRGMLELVLVAAATFVVVTVFRRRRPPTVFEPTLSVQPAMPAPTPQDMLRLELAALEAKRDRQSVLRVRTVLWEIIGAHPGETLGDVLRRPPAQEPRTRRLLTLVERAAFIEDARLPQAIDEVLAEREGTFA